MRLILLAFISATIGQGRAANPTRRTMNSRKPHRRSNAAAALASLKNQQIKSRLQNQHPVSQYRVSQSNSKV